MNHQPILAGRGITMDMMDTILIAAIYALILFGLPALAAAYKNRNPWVWGSVFTALAVFMFFLKLGDWAILAWFVSLLVLTLFPFVCPKCNGKLTYHEWKERQCPECGSLKDE